MSHGAKTIDPHALTTRLYDGSYVVTARGDHKSDQAQANYHRLRVRTILAMGDGGGVRLRPSLPSSPKI